MSDIHRMAEDAVRPHARELAAEHALRSELIPMTGSTPTNDEIAGAMCDLARRLTSESKDLPAEYSKLIDDNLLDLLA